MENALETLVAARARGVQILKHGGKIDQAAPRSSPSSSRARMALPWTSMI
jgi:hypothetical protein